ncbi:MAG: sigma-54 dependent transcriptional regulator [Dongiaceae bacterium]
MTAVGILVVDDDPVNRDLLTQQLDGVGSGTIALADGPAAVARLAGGFDGILVADIKMPRMDGLELLRRARAADPELPVILVTGYGDIAMAVEAMRDGAYDFIQRPYEAARLREMVGRALQARALVLENRALRAALQHKAGLEARLLGGSAAIEALRRAVAAIADTDANVLVIGETGTGKEVVARALHELGGRRQRRFVPVNCAALPESLVESELFGHEAGAFTGAARRRAGRLEHAHGGTLFLDEVDSLPLALQGKLLRALQERVVERLGSNEPVSTDFRVVAATQKDLLAAAAAGAFRQDLFYRLDVAELRIPPLRERREDIPLLFEAFVLELAARHGRQPPRPGADDLRALMSHDWPGNVRELRNAAERYVLGLHRAGGSFAGLASVAGERPQSLAQQLDAFERCLIEQALARHQGRIQAVADELGLPVRTLNDRMRRHGLSRTAHRT